LLDNSVNIGPSPHKNAFRDFGRGHNLEVGQSKNQVNTPKDLSDLEESDLNVFGYERATNIRAPEATRELEEALRKSKLESGTGPKDFAFAKAAPMSGFVKFGALVPPKQQQIFKNPTKKKTAEEDLLPKATQNEGPPIEYPHTDKEGSARRQRSKVKKLVFVKTPPQKKRSRLFSEGDA